MKNIFVITLMSVLFLSGCTGDRCIDADDFGFIKFVVSSRYKKEELGEQQQDNQIAPWRNSEYRVNGQPITIVVKPWSYKAGDKNNSQELSAWCPWYGQKNNTATLSEFCARLQECQFINGVMCTATKDARIQNAPCLLKNGVGLYFLIAERGSDPNSSFDKQRAPDGITRHLGEPLKDYKLYDLNKRGELVQAGGIRYLYSDSDKVKYSQCSLYFKILDKFYDDNNGQYRMVIKSGVSDTRPDPIQFLTNLILNELFGVDGKDYGLVRKFYQNIIDTPSYRLVVSTMLTLYVVLTGASFLIGNVNLTHTELIIRVAKVTLISILLSSANSWNFFHDYLFVYFVEGIMQILQVINEAATTGPGSASIIGLMIAPQTFAKVFSLLFIDPLGFVYILLFIIALYFIFMMVLQATIIYLTALIAIGMIIVMAPIFICFLLFGITCSLFENWLRQLISYAIQPIILFTGLAFISMIIRTEIYSSLGFGICKYDFPDLGPIGEIFGSITEDLDVSIGNSIFYWWFPSPMGKGKFSKIKAAIPVPMDHRVDDGSPDGKLCVAYECIEERYIELPFLDPVKDQRRINDFFSGKFVQLDGLLLIFVSVYLLSKFNGISVSIARFISSTSGNLTALQSVGQAAFTPIKDQINRPVNYATSKVREGMDSVKEIISAPIAEVFEKRMIKGLKQEALDPSSAKSSVLNRIKRNYGIDYNDVDKKAINTYRDAIKDSIKDMSPNMSDTDIDNHVNSLSDKKYSDLRNGLAALKFGEGKKYDLLDTMQRGQIDDLMQGKNFRELASEANYTRDFQKLYVDEFLDMSGEGKGIFSKNISFIESLRDMDNRVKETRKLRDEKRLNFGESLYAGYTGVKRGVLAGIVGKDLVSAFEGNLTSAEWHDFDYNDPRLRTYSEQVKDKKSELQERALKLKINKETLSANNDVLSPEYLTRLEQQGRINDKQYYKELSNKNLAFDIYKKLSNGEDPVLMGDKFMREKATNSQMSHMIKKAYDIQQQMIEEDRYTRRQERYEIMHEKYANNILGKYNELSNHYQNDNIKLEEIPSLLERYYKESNMSDNDIRKEISDFDESVSNFNYSKGVLEELEDRKGHIRDEIDQYVDKINEYREKANMIKDEKPVHPEGRKLKTIEDRLSKNL